VPVQCRHGGVTPIAPPRAFSFGPEAHSVEVFELPAGTAKQIPFIESSLVHVGEHAGLIGDNTLVAGESPKRTVTESDTDEVSEQNQRKPKLIESRQGEADHRRSLWTE